MFAPLSAVGLAAVLLVAGSDSVPTLDTAPSCRDASTLGEDLNATFNQCMSDEREALGELQKQWKQFSLSDRQSCAAEQSDIVGMSSLSSYVELLECLVLAREAANPTGTMGSGPTGTTGSGPTGTTGSGAQPQKK
jgi:hypothetical protein